MSLPSYSRNATLYACPRKYEYGYEWQLESMDVNVPAFAGQCMAEALLHLHTVEKEHWQKDMEKAHQNVVAALEAAWGDFQTPPGKYDYLTVGHLETVLYHYMRDRDPLQVMPLSESGKVLAETKTEFDWPMLQDNGEVELIRVTGIPDIPAVVAGQKAVVDWKCTTMYVNDWWAKKFSVIGHQLRTYMEMLRHEYGITVDTAYVDGIFIGKNAAEDDKYWKTVKSVRSKLFGPFNFTESQRKETWHWYNTAEKLKNLHRETGYWPQNEGACGMYGGCEFQNLCGMSPKVREARAASLFRRKES